METFKSRIYSHWGRVSSREKDNIR